jgi:hypothetical protein
MGALALFRPARSPARQSLANAIAEAVAADAASIAAREAIGRGHRLVDECEERVAQAVEAVAAAKSAQAWRMAASAATAGALLAADRGIREARARHTDAEDELDAARAALVELERAADAAQKRAIEAKTAGIKLAAAGVVAVEIDATISRAIALRSELETRIVSLNQECAKIRFFLDKCFTKYGSSASTEKYEDMNRILENSRQFLDQKILGPVYHDWYKALSALESDADGQLPSGFLSFGRRSLLSRRLGKPIVSICSSQAPVETIVRRGRRFQAWWTWTAGPDETMRFQQYQRLHALPSKTSLQGCAKTTPNIGRSLAIASDAGAAKVRVTINFKIVQAESRGEISIIFGEGSQQWIREF